MSQDLTCSSCAFHLQIEMVIYMSKLLQFLINILCVCLDSKSAFPSCVFIFIFFLFSRVLEYCGYCSMNSNRKCWLSAVNSVHMHYSRTHKFHFLSIFSLKMGFTALFTHLKIILLQCFQFSVFSFSKISSIQTHP